jgi:hypothetical protein
MHPSAISFIFSNMSTVVAWFSIGLPFPGDSTIA